MRYIKTYFNLSPVKSDLRFSKKVRYGLTLQTMTIQYVPRSACALCTKAASKDGGAEGERGAENQQSGDVFVCFLLSATESWESTVG